MMSYEYPHPVSRTYQYKKITKPLLERKRRARINKCLDELKNLMIDTLEADVEDVSKLEKADILELTVRHLQKLQGSKCPGFSSTVTTDEISAENRWLSGFGHCAAEAYRFLSTLPGEGAERLAKHLAAGLQKNLQASSSQKTNMLTQILASLNLTTDLVTPSVANSNIKNNRVTCSDHSATCRGVIREMSENQREQHAVKSVKTDVEVEDEEEIDVERIDDADPMWRPW